MMKPAAAVCQVAGIGDIVGFVVAGESTAAKRSVVELNHFGHAAAERRRNETADRIDVARQQIDVIETPGRDRPIGRVLRLVLERRPLIGWRLVALGFVVDLEDVAVWIVELVGGAVRLVVVMPADAGAERLDGFDPPLQRLPAR
jgi:hypothetical protein